MIQGLRLRAAVTNVNGIVQQVRIQSVRDNRAYTLKTIAATAGNGITIFIDGPATGLPMGNGTIDPGEPSIQLPVGTTISDGTGGPGVLPPNVVLPTYITGNTINLSFNERGLPCNDPPVCRTVKPYVIYFDQARTSGTDGWAAITVTQAGRIKAYTFTGGAADTWQ